LGNARPNAAPPRMASMKPAACVSTIAGGAVKPVPRGGLRDNGRHFPSVNKTYVFQTSRPV
jgi:hypothetical protein